VKAGIEISKRLVLVNSSSAVLRKVLSLGVLVWLKQYLLRRISPEEYSLLPVLMALIIFFPLLTTMFVSGLRRYVTDAYARGDERQVTRLVSTMLPLLVGIACVLLCVGGGCAWLIDRILEIDPRYVGQARLMFGLLILGASARVAVGPLGLGFDLRQRFLLRNMIGLGAELIRTALLVGLLLLSTRVLWVVVANTAATLIELVVATRVSMKLAPCLRFRRAAFQREAARPLLSFGGWSVLSQLCFMIREAADPLILQRLASAVAVTSFDVGSLFDRHVRTTFLQATFAAQPAITAMNATEQHERLRRTYLRMTRYSLWMLGFLSLPLVVFRRGVLALPAREIRSLCRRSGRHGAPDGARDRDLSQLDPGNAGRRQGRGSGRGPARGGDHHRESRADLLFRRGPEHGCGGVRPRDADRHPRRSSSPELDPGPAPRADDPAGVALPDLPAGSRAGPVRRSPLGRVARAGPARGLGGPGPGLRHGRPGLRAGHLVAGDEFRGAPRGRGLAGAPSPRRSQRVASPMDRG